MWRRYPCVVCGSWLSKYWTAHRTCSWKCELEYAEKMGWLGEHAS
jgi:hypothetical protein